MVYYITILHLYSYTGLGKTWAIEMNLFWIVPLVQDRSLDLLSSTSARYHLFIQYCSTWFTVCTTLFKLTEPVYWRKFYRIIFMLHYVHRNIKSQTLIGSSCDICKNVNICQNSMMAYLAFVQQRTCKGEIIDLFSTRTGMSPCSNSQIFSWRIKQHSAAACVGVNDMKLYASTTIWNACVLWKSIRCKGHLRSIVEIILPDTW